MEQQSSASIADKSDPIDAEQETFEPVLTIEGSGDSGLILLCDHARNFIPPHYEALGLPKEALSRHIAYDIGTEALTMRLAEHLGAAAAMACYSRLVIDPNRGEDDPTLIVTVSDGMLIPGNDAIDEAERRLRQDRYYEPYHRAVDDLIEAKLAAGRQPVLVSIHSFTPFMFGEERPWQVGVLWQDDPDLAHRLIDYLSADPALIVGDNEPYSGAAPTNSTLNRHAVARGLSHVLIEIRQDLIADDLGVEAWTDRLVPFLSRL